MIELDGKNMFPFVGDFKPVKVWNGNKVVYEPEIVTKSDPQTIIEKWTYNYRHDGLEIKGKTTQDGVPSPDNPVEPVSFGGNLFVRNSYPSLVEYTDSTWTEFTKSGGTSVVSGYLNFANNGSAIFANINTDFKVSTKYGFLVNVRKNTRNVNSYINTNNTGNPFNAQFIIGANTTGRQKFVATSKTTITNNKIDNYFPVGTGEFEYGELVAFELPAGSQIEKDFDTTVVGATNLTPDQLALKYPFCSKERIQKPTFNLGVLRGKDGVEDTWELRWNATEKCFHAWHVQRCPEYVFTGNESWTVASKLTNTVRLYLIGHSTVGNNNNLGIISNYFVAKAPHIDEESVNLTGAYPGGLINIRIAWSRIGCTGVESDSVIVNALKSFLATHYANGTPVKAIYQLATPIETDLGAVDVPTWYPMTVLQLSEPSGGMTAEYKAYRKD